MYGLCSWDLTSFVCLFLCLVFCVPVRLRGTVVQHCSPLHDRHHLNFGFLLKKNTSANLRLLLCSWGNGSLSFRGWWLGLFSEQGLMNGDRIGISGMWYKITVGVLRPLSLCFWIWVCLANVYFVQCISIFELPSNFCPLPFDISSRLAMLNYVKKKKSSLKMLINLNRTPRLTNCPPRPLPHHPPPTARFRGQPSKRRMGDVRTWPTR